MDIEGDIFQATRLDNGKAVIVSLTEKIGIGSVLPGNEKKSKVTVLINPEASNSRPVNMVRKVVGVAGGADKYYWTWNKLKEAGIPTVPTVRKVNDEEVIMTDMTADGSTFFGKADVIESFNRHNSGNLRELDRHFLNIDLDDVNARARVIASSATLRGVSLPFDDPMDLLVHPDGSWEVIVLDIDSQMDGHSEGREWNNRAVHKFESHLKDVQRGLAVGGEPPFLVL